MAATPSARPRLWQWSHRPVATTARNGTVLMAERPSTAPGGDVGVADMPSNRWGGGGTTASTERRGQKLQRGQPEQIEPRGQDRLGEARRRSRRTAAKPTNPHGQGFRREVSELICSGNCEQTWGTKDNSIRPRVCIHFSFLETVTWSSRIQVRLQHCLSPTDRRTNRKNQSDFGRYA
jgi:hypothetical protein